MTFWGFFKSPQERANFGDIPATRSSSAGRSDQTPQQKVGRWADQPRHAKTCAMSIDAMSIPRTRNIVQICPASTSYHQPHSQLIRSTSCGGGVDVGDAGRWRRGRAENRVKLPRCSLQRSTSKDAPRLPACSSISTLCFGAGPLASQISVVAPLSARRCAMKRWGRKW